MVYVPPLRCREHKRIAAEVASFTDVMIFWKIMTRHSVKTTCAGKWDMPMEFPWEFITKYVQSYGELTSATLQRAISDTVWPLVVTKRKLGKVDRVTAYGSDGWTRFVEENGVNIGELLVFLHIGNSQFMVFMFPKCSQCSWCVHGVPCE